MAQSVALALLSYDEPVSTYVTQMCRPRGAEEKSKARSDWEAHPPLPTTENKQSHTVTGQMTQAGNVLH